MKTKTLALIHTVRWYDKVITVPFAEPWLKQNPDVQIFNIMDDSLLAECLGQGKATKSSLKRLQLYVMAAEEMGADVAMITCTTVGEAARIARQYASIPVFNIDEPMSRQAVRQGRRIGVVATVPSSPTATKRLLERCAEEAGTSVNIEVVLNERAFEHLQRGEIEAHDRLVCEELDRLAERVDVLVMGQISLAQVRHETRVPIYQVGHTGFAEARRLLDEVAG